MTGHRTQWVLRLVLLFCGALVIAILARTSTVRGVGGRFFGLLERPFTVVGSEVSEQGSVVLLSRSELIRALETAEGRVVALAQELSNREEEDRQLAQALALLNYQETSGRDVLPARVMVRNSQFDHEQLLIDAGSRSGLEVGDAVISSEGLLIGVVEELYEQTAYVSLLTNANSAVGASLLDTAGTLGVVSGSAGRLVRFGFVPQDTQVEVNDVVITSGVDPRIPRGIIIGLVNAIEVDESAPFLNLLVEPLVDLEHLRFVGVITIDPV